MDAKPRELYLLFRAYEGYEGSLLKVTSKNGKTASVSWMNGHAVDTPHQLLQIESNSDIDFFPLARRICDIQYTGRRRGCKARLTGKVKVPVTSLITTEFPLSLDTKQHFSCYSTPPKPYLSSNQHLPEVVRLSSRLARRNFFHPHLPARNQDLPLHVSSTPQHLSPSCVHKCSINLIKTIGKLFRSGFF